MRLIGFLTVLYYLFIIFLNRIWYKNVCLIYPLQHYFALTFITTLSLYIILEHVTKHRRKYNAKTLLIKKKATNKLDKKTDKLLSTSKEEMV